MAIVVNGTTIDNSLGKIVCNNTNVTKVICNGVTVWTSKKSVTLTNLIPNKNIDTGGGIFHHANVDAGWSDYNAELINVSIIPGHRYAIHATGKVIGSSPSSGVNQILVRGNRSGDYEWVRSNLNYGAIIDTSKVNSMAIYHHWTGSTNTGWSAGWGMNLYTCIDVTPLENALGRRLTSYQDMINCMGGGSWIWYGNKTVQI